MSTFNAGNNTTDGEQYHSTHDGGPCGLGRPPPPARRPTTDKEKGFLSIQCNARPLCQRWAWTA